MADDPEVEKGLTWPEEYRDLLPLIRDDWGVEDEIYLIRKLSGKSGALVYAADMTGKSFKGQAILKLDHAPDPAWNEENEAERHRRAYEAAPEFGAEHLPQLLHSLHHGRSLAILSSIAGRGLEYAVPWIDCPYDQQMSVVQKMSAQLLEGWNRNYAMAEGTQGPRHLLRSWLDYRLDPNEGRIHEFVTQDCGLSPTEPSFTFEGHWYPNPLAFALSEHPLPENVQLRAAKGSQHFDLHGNNVLVGAARNAEPSYYLIDLAMYQDSQYLFYDHAYFELSYLLAMREAASAASWISILYHLSSYYEPEDKAGLKSDDRGPIQLVDALREEVLDWVDRHEKNRLSYMESQYTLARVAAGLSFTHKQLPARARRMAYIYAAFNLKDYLQFQGIDWPKHGPALASPEQTPGAITAQAEEVPRNTASPASEPLTSPSLPAASKSRAAIWLSASAAVVLVLAVATGLWFWWPRMPVTEPPATETAELPAAVKPSIVVLPFRGLTPGNETTMFTDGMTSAITAALAAVPELFVIARGSARQYKGQTTDVRKVAKDFRVRYVLEGTLQKSGDNVRVTTELIDGETGENVWGRNYDRKTDDIFALQDEIALDVLIALQVKLTARYQAATQGHSTNNLQAYLLFIRAQSEFQKYTEESMFEVQRLTDRILKLDPKFRLAYVLKARSHIINARFGRGDKHGSWDKAAELLREAAALDGHISNSERAEILVAEAAIDFYAKRYDKALATAKKATVLAPNNNVAMAIYGYFLYFSRDYDRSITYLKRAIRLGPTYPSFVAMYLARNYAFKGDTTQAIKWAKRGVSRAESDLMRALNLANLAFVYEEAGRDADAKRAAEEVRLLAPYFTTDYYRKLQPYRYQEDWKRFENALWHAGIP